MGGTCGGTGICTGAGATARGARCAWPPLGKGAYVRCGPVSRPLRLSSILPTAPAFAFDDEAPALAADEAACAALLFFAELRAERNMPSGTTRSRSIGIESIVARLPSVDFVKYASVLQRRGRREVNGRWAGHVRMREREAGHKESCRTLKASSRERRERRECKVETGKRKEMGWNAQEAGRTHILQAARCKPREQKEARQWGDREGKAKLDGASKTPERN